MADIKNYIFFCETENANVSKWDTDIPTTCPNNSEHTINPDSITVTETISKNKFIAEENSFGYFETRHFINNVPSSEPGLVTEYDITWDSDITLWRTILSMKENMIGDEVKLVAVPDTIIGLTSQGINSGDTVIHVDQNVLANAMRGFECVLNDGIHKHVTVITDINKVNGTVTIKDQSPYNFSIIPFKIGVFIVRYLKMHDIKDEDIGLKGMKGKEITKGYKIRVYYTNNNGLAKEVVWRAEYYNNG